MLLLDVVVGAVRGAVQRRPGRQLIRGYYFGKMPPELAKDFASQYDLDPDVIKHNLYKEPNPNAYLATFAKFLIQHKDHPWCQEIIEAGMEDFVSNYILQFDNARQVPIHFIGSIAFYLRDELEAVLASHGLRVGNVLRRPIDGLIQYHALNK